MRGESIYRGMTVLHSVSDAIMYMYDGMYLPVTVHSAVDLKIAFDFSPPSQQEAARRFSDALLADIPASKDWHIRAITSNFSRKRIYLVSEDFAISYEFPRKRTVFQIKDFSLAMSDFDYPDRRPPLILKTETGEEFEFPISITDQLKDQIFKPRWNDDVKTDDEGIPEFYKVLSSQVDLDDIASADKIARLTSTLARVIHDYPSSLLLWIFQYYFIFPVIYIINADKLEAGIVKVKKYDFSKAMPVIQDISVNKNSIKLLCSDGFAFGLRLYATGKKTHSLDKVSVDLILRKDSAFEKTYFVK